MRRTTAAVIGTMVLALSPTVADGAAKRRPTVTVKPRTPGATELIEIRTKNLPRLRRDEHYRVVVWTNPNSTDLECSFTGTKDWLEPSGVGLVMPDDGLMAGWCVGPASVTVARVPNSSPKSYKVKVVVTRRFRIVR